MFPPYFSNFGLPSIQSYSNSVDFRVPGLDFNTSGPLLPTLATNTGVSRPTSDISGRHPINHTSPVTSTSYPGLKFPKWKLQFDGSEEALDIHDFIFRLETYARNDGCDPENLVGLLPTFLTGTAEAWYWVFTRKYGGVGRITWEQLKGALVRRFTSHESEREIRRTIETRKQRTRESFGDYLLQMESLNGRLSHPYKEEELLDIIRVNMDPALQSATITTPITNTEEMRVWCQKFEKLWSKSGYDPRQTFKRHAKPQHHVTVHALESLPEDEYVDNSEPIEDLAEVSALKPSRNPDSYRLPLQYDICWNCKDIGHRYIDCSKTPQHVFCYGCGRPNVLKPNCLSCQKRRTENLTPNAMKPGALRLARDDRYPRGLSMGQVAPDPNRTKGDSIQPEQ